MSNPLLCRRGPFLPTGSLTRTCFLCQFHLYTHAACFLAWCSRELGSRRVNTVMAAANLAGRRYMRLVLPGVYRLQNAWSFAEILGTESTLYHQRITMCP